MHYKGLGREEAKTTWYKNGKKKTIAELQDHLIEIIKLTKQWHVPDEPPTTAPQRIEMPILGTLSNPVKDLDRKAKAKETEFNKDAQKYWQQREDIGYTSVLDQMQQLGELNIDDSFIGTQMDYLSDFDLVGEVNMKELCCCGGIFENISDDACVNPGNRRQYYKENEAAFVFWDAVLEADYPASRSIEPFDEKKWNNNCYGTWRKELSAIDDGL